MLHANFSRFYSTICGCLTLGAVFFGTAYLAHADDLIFYSTQLRPLQEAQAMREDILSGGPKTTYVVDEPAPFAVRVTAEEAAGNVSVSLLGALHGELQPLASANALDTLSDLAPKLEDLKIPPGLMALGKLGTPNQLYIPWMQATYVLVVYKKALAYLPQGAKVDALTYQDLAAWGAAIAAKTGERKIGFPAGPKGLMPRFLQGYLYPSFTGTMVRGFRSAAATSMWNDFKTLWASVNPNSTSYDFMQEPLQTGEVWIAWDHIARVKEALKNAPDDFLVVPAPAGPKGRAYMPVVSGLAITKGAPKRAEAEALILHLLKPGTQLTTAIDVGFFPVVDVKLPDNLPPEIKLLADGIAKTQTSADALPVLLPVGLGDKGGEFNKVYMDTFQRIVLRGEAVTATLDAQADVLRAILATTKAPCWAPDAPSEGACPVQ